MTIRLTHLEDALADSPGPVSSNVGAKLNAAQATLEGSLRMPLPPAQYAQVQSLMQAVRAAEAILESIARRYSTSYGKLAAADNDHDDRRSQKNVQSTR
ncbi:EscE/YscE/SsaE family type III secretion system needle protein co-chaperone [Pandoraea anapnoica]|uniref:EscE/YscE/SsaE family type III secretion system needle protein co-chaperone n=1 Tax=Pandoraea anapnoica TaxID=2508301 RepID=A0A5E5ADW4_9BURK|nr:EscE/YscE/SsaE family type III secretion system needle protein co-chaperone [Pandoraea anapnoica]VVE71388.1 EscE/YscE/SsaE family type III secretion system needle protein co-chaperone [Pandoraea anapnoica]